MQVGCEVIQCTTTSVDRALQGARGDGGGCKCLQHLTNAMSTSINMMGGVARYWRGFLACHLCLTHLHIIPRHVQCVFTSLSNPKNLANDGPHQLTLFICIHRWKQEWGAGGSQPMLMSPLSPSHPHHCHCQHPKGHWACHWTCTCALGV